MGDETPVAGGFMYRLVNDGEWENLGYVCDDGISLSSGDDEELEVWAGRLVELSNEPVTIAVRPHWWALNNLYRLVTGRPRYTISMLRRWNKGHRRSR